MAYNRSAGLSFRQDLLGAFAEFDPAAEGLIGMQIFTPMPVRNIADSFKKIKADQLSSVESTKRNPDGSFNRIHTKLDDDSYSCSEEAIEEAVDNTEAKIFGDYIADDAGARRVAATVMRNHEIDSATALFNTTNFPQDGVSGVAVSAEWNSSNGVPITDVNTWKQNTRLRTGRLPNTMVISAKVASNLATNPQIIDRIKNVDIRVVSGMLSAAQLAQVFDIPKVLIGGAVKNGNGEGLSFSGSDIWDDEYAWIGHTASGMDLKSPQVGRTFVWETPDGQTVIESYDEPQRDARVIRARHWRHIKVIYATAGVLLSNIST